jgi:hypothetical protein
MYAECHKRKKESRQKAVFLTLALSLLPLHHTVNWVHGLDTFTFIAIRKTAFTAATLLNTSFFQKASASANANIRFVLRVKLSISHNALEVSISIFIIGRHS